MQGARSSNSLGYARQHCSNKYEASSSKPSLAQAEPAQTLLQGKNRVECFRIDESGYTGFDLLNAEQRFRELGAHHVVNYNGPLNAALRQAGVPSVTYAAMLTQTDSHFPQIVEAIAPQGHSAVIDDPKTLDIVPLKRKSVAVHWKLMFMRPLFQTPDMARQHEILCRVAGLIDDESTMARCVLRLASISVDQCCESAPRACAD